MELECMNCHFNDPNFIILTYEPCPVCGVRALPYNSVEDIENKCVEGLLGNKDTKDDNENNSV